MILKELARIQKELKAPKGQFNNFGKYKYRSCEDILEAVKPLLGDCVLTLSDEVVEVGGRVYIKATATLSKDPEKGTEPVMQCYSVTAYAREAEDKKGMDDSQITGTASSYARKYALNGLFCIDDTKDADTDEHTSERTKTATKAKPAMSTAEQMQKANGYAEDVAKITDMEHLNRFHVGFSGVKALLKGPALDVAKAAYLQAKERITEKKVV